MKAEIEAGVAHIIVEIIEYMPKSVVSRTILNKSTGHVSLMSFDTGEGLLEKTSPFDTFAQVIDGKAEIVVDGKMFLLNTGEGMIIPAHRTNRINANERFKIIMTVIKSGYED